MGGRGDDAEAWQLELLRDDMLRRALSGSAAAVPDDHVQRLAPAMVQPPQPGLHVPAQRQKGAGEGERGGGGCGAAAAWPGLERVRELAADVGARVPPGVFTLEIDERRDKSLAGSSKGMPTHDDSSITAAHNKNSNNTNFGLLNGGLARGNDRVANAQRNASESVNLRVGNPQVCGLSWVT